ncbi:hypothetical protein SISNIDRAFT_533617 [Sistotremastrum niveocremeum HHB9708]|uniref:Uncharacterized protein n=1 Tax=Sistotremastrum niveocremeum HHB9708 TaxID=1314777 RepID=A0A164YAB0_9AGAM|nr:hypothetical protein SISNIDRAFT_533617 [Sistotremastrum niveocremeum HHB9708]
MNSHKRRGWRNASFENNTKPSPRVRWTLSHADTGAFNLTTGRHQIPSTLFPSLDYPCIYSVQAKNSPCRLRHSVSRQIHRLASARYFKVDIPQERESDSSTVTRGDRQPSICRVLYLSELPYSSSGQGSSTTVHAALAFLSNLSDLTSGACTASKKRRWFGIFLFRTAKVNSSDVVTNGTSTSQSWLREDVFSHGSVGEAITSPGDSKELRQVHHIETKPAPVIRSRSQSPSPASAPSCVPVPKSELEAEYWSHPLDLVEGYHYLHEEDGSFRYSSDRFPTADLGIARGYQRGCERLAGRDGHCGPQCARLHIFYYGLTDYDVLKSRIEYRLFGFIQEERISKTAKSKILLKAFVNQLVIG